MKDSTDNQTLDLSRKGARLSPADKQRAYRQRNAVRLQATRPSVVRDQLQDFVLGWSEATEGKTGSGSRRAKGYAFGAIMFAESARLISQDEADTLYGLVEATPAVSEFGETLD